jgi:hypothetical protein
MLALYRNCGKYSNPPATECCAAEEKVLSEISDGTEENQMVEAAGIEPTSDSQP